MKINPAKLPKPVVRSIDMGINVINGVITAAEMAVRFWPLLQMYVRVAIVTPKRLWDYRNEMRRIGLYQFTDRSRKSRQFNLLVLDSDMEATKVTDSSATRQAILNALREAVAVDKFCPDFEVPELFHWSHPHRGLKIERLRDATSDERKAYRGSPLREIPDQYLTYMGR